MESDITFTEQQKHILERRDISEDEVSECISEKVDEGMDREQAVAACLNMAEEGSSEPEKNVKSFRVKGSDIELVKNETDGAPVVNIPIQSLSEDRDGDLINEKGQESIIRQLKSGMVPLVPNHGMGNSTAMYGFEDIFGQFVDGENRNGTTIGTARLRDGHEMTKELVDLLEQDMPVGFSVGFKVLEAEPREKEEGHDEGLEISKVDLMEVSAVGIPSNPEAVPQAMGGAVAMAKQAGLSKDKIMETVRKSFEDTMSENQKEDDTDTNSNSEPQQEADSKSEENKQYSDDEVQEILGVVGGALESHMDEALQDIESELQSEEEPDEEDEMDDEDEETDEMDEDEDEEDSVQQSNDEPEEQDSEDEEKDSETDEEKESDIEKTADKNKQENQEINEPEEQDSEEKSEDEELEDPFAVRQL